MADLRRNDGIAPSLWSLLLFFASYCLYIFTASPAMGWLDSPEFIAQSVSLGIAHSPGHPLVALLGKLATLVPIGDMVWRVNLMSGLCAALAVTFFFSCGRLLLEEVSPQIGQRTRQALAALFAMLLAISWALWSNAVRAEVYALQSLLSTAAIFYLLQFSKSGQVRYLLLTSFLLALGLANHHFLTLIILLPASLFVLRKSLRPTLRALYWTAAFGICGLGALAYLPIRSLTHPLVNFGAPHTLERFFWTLRGAAFSKSIGADHASDPILDTVQVLVALSEALTLPLLCMSGFGVYALWKTQKHRPLGLLFLGIALLCILARVILGFDPETPDHHAYLLPAIFSLFLLALSGLSALIVMALQAKRPLPKAPVLALMACSLLLPLTLLANWKHSNQANAWASDDLAHWEIDALPPSSLLLLAYFQTTFRMSALHVVEGARPDLTVLDRSFLTYPGMSEEAKIHRPEFSDLIDAPLRAGMPTPIAMLKSIAKNHPVFAELHINVDPPFAKTLIPAGPFALFGHSSSEQSEVQDAQAHQNLAALLNKDVSPAEKQSVKAALLWRGAMRLDQLCILGRKFYAIQVYKEALALAPQDISLLEMAERCGLDK